MSPLPIALTQVGTRSLAIPRQDVRFIVPMPHEYCYAGQGAESFFVYEGKALPYLSLWDIIGVPSCYAEYQEMAKLLPERRQDHIDWMTALEVSLVQDAPFNKARSPYECAFGKWYYSFSPKDERLRLTLSYFDAPHARIHGLAEGLLRRAQGGDRDGAIRRLREARGTTLQELLQFFDMTTEICRALQRRVFVIVQREEQSCALGADRVLNLLSVPEDRLQRSQHLDAARRKAQHLCLLENGSIATLFDWREHLATPDPA
jgi:hypothetical protein